MATCPDPDSSLGDIQGMITGPRRVSVDGVDYQSRSAQDMIALDRYVKSACAAKYGFCALRSQQAVPPNGLGVSTGVMNNAGSSRIW